MHSSEKLRPLCFLGFFSRDKGTKIFKSTYVITLQTSGACRVKAKVYPPGELIVKTIKYKGYTEFNFDEF